MGLQILPYVQVDGQWSVSDTYLKSLWQKMEEQNLVQKVFYAGEIKDEQGWINLCKNPRNILHLVLDEENEAVSVIWLNGLQMSFAFAHFVCFKKIWGKRTKEVADESFKHWFSFKKKDDTPLFDVIIGKTPDANISAINFIKRIGMNVIGTIPNIAYDIYLGKKMGLVISYIERKEIESWET